VGFNNLITITYSQLGLLGLGTDKGRSASSLEFFLVAATT